MSKKTNIFSGFPQQNRSNKKVSFLQQSPGVTTGTPVRASFEHLTNLEHSPNINGSNDPSNNLVPPSRAPTISTSNFMNNNNIRNKIDNSINSFSLTNSSASFQTKSNNKQSTYQLPQGANRQSTKSFHQIFDLSPNRQAYKQQQHIQSPTLSESPQIKQMNNPIQYFQVQPQSTPLIDFGQHIPYRRCARHIQESIKRACSVYSCKNPVLLCGDCMYEDPDHTKAHQQQILLLPEFFELIDKEEAKGKWKQQRAGEYKELIEEGMKLQDIAQGIYQQYSKETEKQKIKIHQDASIIIQQFTEFVKEQEKVYLNQIEQLQLECEQIITSFREEINAVMRGAQQQNQLPMRAYLEQNFASNPDTSAVEQIFKSARDSLFVSSPAVFQQLTIEAVKENWQKMNNDIGRLKQSVSEISLDTSEVSNRINEFILQLFKKQSNAGNLQQQNRKDKETNQININQANLEYPQFGAASLSQQQNQMQSKITMVFQQPLLESNNKDYLINNLLQGSSSKDTDNTNLEYDYNRNNNNRISNNSIKSANKINLESQSNSLNTTAPAIVNQSQSEGLNISNNQSVSKDQNYSQSLTQSDNKVTNSTTIMSSPSSSGFDYQSKQKAAVLATKIQPANGIVFAFSSKANTMTIKPKFQQTSPQEQHQQQQQISQDLSPVILDKSNNSIQPQLFSSNSLPSFQNCQIMGGSKVASIIQSSGNSIHLSQIPKDIPLQDSPSPTCFCIIGDMIVACGDTSGFIKIYDLQTQSCVGVKNINLRNQFKYDNNNSKEQQNSSILSMTYVLYQKQQQQLICCVTQQPEQPQSGDNNNNMIYNIDICNIQDDQQSFRLESSTEQLVDKSSIGYNYGRKESIPSISKVNQLNPISLNNINYQNDHSANKMKGQTEDNPLFEPQIKSMEDGRNIIVQSNKTTVTFWDLFIRRQVAKIKTEFDITSVLSMGRELQSVLLALNTCEIAIYQVEYGKTNHTDENISGRMIMSTQFLRKVSLESQQPNLSQSSVMIQLLNQKVVISIGKTIYIWNATSLTQENQLQPYQYSNSSDNITDLLAISRNDCIYLLCACQHDGFILLQPASSTTQGMKHHLKDFAFPARMKQNRLLMTKNSENQLFLIALNANKPTLTFWRLHGDGGVQ